MQIPVVYELVGDVSTTQFLLLVCFLLTIVYYVYQTSHHGEWEKLGVPGPKPWPIVDHKFELNKGMDVAVTRWFNQYGSTFGAYGLLPHRAVLVTKDVSLVKNILVKDFDCFVDRDFPQKTTSSLQYSLTNSVGDRWRRIRHVTSPMFTGARLKTILKHVCASAENLTQLTKEKLSKRQLIPLKLVASKFATEVIARIGFGVETHAVSEEESEFAYYARNLIILNSKFREYVDKINQYFPTINGLLNIFNISVDFVNKKADDYFVSIIKSSIKERKNEINGPLGDTSRDLLDMLLDAEVESNDPRLKDNNTRTLSHDEIVGNSTMLIMGGVETVSVAFETILYSLALYPLIQDKVIEEIENVFPKGTTVKYDELKDLKYTEQVIHECLRYFPLASTILRVASETKTYGNITIPKGTCVIITLGDIMKDPDHWLDPEKFDPDRFSPENKVGRDPLAFMPFGYGPRICMGMRLAMMELKVVLVYLLREVRFTLSERTEPKKGEKLVMKKFGMIAVRPANPTELEAIPRE